MRKIIPLLIVVAVVSFFLGTAAVKMPNMAEPLVSKKTIFKHAARTVQTAKPQQQPQQQEVAEPPVATTDALPLLEEALTPPTTSKANPAPTKSERLTLLHEKFRREWESRRARVFRQIGLKSAELKALKAAREKFYQDSDLAIVDLKSINTHDDAENVISESDYTNESYDEYVKSLIGEERFSVLEDALSKMNADIQKKAPNKFVFVSAW